MGGCPHMICLLHVCVFINSGVTAPSPILLCIILHLMCYFYAVCRFAVADVMAPPLATTYHLHSHTTDVEVHPSPSLPPLGRKLDSPKREGPIQKLVTVVRRDSSKSPGAGKRGAAHQIEDANFADVPAHDEAPMTQDHKVSPMISKYVPRNLRESISVNGFSEKGNRYVSMQYVCKYITYIIYT